MRSQAFVLAAAVLCVGAVRAQSPSTPTTPAPSLRNSSSPRHPGHYKIVEIPARAPNPSNLKVIACSAAGVNSQGIVVGQCEYSCGCSDYPLAGFERAWMYDEKSGALTELIFEPSELGAVATNISNTGVVTGEEATTSLTNVPGFWTVTGGAMLLQPVASVEIVTMGIGQNGKYIAATEGAANVPVLWSGADYSTITSLPLPTCNPCGEEDLVAVNAVNDSGTAVGDGPVNVPNSPTGTEDTAIEWRDGTVTSLGTLPGGTDSAAYGINNNGDVVGFSWTGPNQSSPARAFLYHAGTMTDIDTLPGSQGSVATAINDSGQIVGDMGFAAPNSNSSFLYENGQMYDLNTLIDPTSPLIGLVQLQGAVSISSNGRIAVNGTDSRYAGALRAFLLIPESVK